MVGGVPHISSFPLHDCVFGSNLSNHMADRSSFKSSLEHDMVHNLWPLVYVFCKSNLEPWAPGFKILFVYKYFPPVRLPFQKEGNLSGSFLLGHSFPKLWTLVSLMFDLVDSMKLKILFSGFCAFLGLLIMHFWYQHHCLFLFLGEFNMSQKGSLFSYCRYKGRWTYGWPKSLKAIKHGKRKSQVQWRNSHMVFLYLYCSESCMIELFLAGQTHYTGRVPSFLWLAITS